jgi:hypothetical protein
MTPNDGASERVLMAVPLRPHGSLSLVSGPDDLYIRRDGRLVSGCFWRPNEIEKAVSEFRHLQNRLRSN